MPEAPDVETYKRYLESTSLNQEIEDVSVKTRQILGDSLTPERLKKALKGNEFESADRRGKYLFIQLKEKPWLVLHFGMTGRLSYFKDEDDEPEYTKARIDFSNGYHLALVMPRKLGHIWLEEKPGDLIAEKDLGPDFISEDFTLDDFLEKMKNKRGMIKSALMDQSFISGIGNVYSDEILYQTRVYPRAQIDSLDQDALEDIYKKGRKIIRQAIDWQADSTNYPDDWLVRHRDDGADCPDCSGKVERITVAGRNGYYCPSCQTRGK